MLCCLVSLPKQWISLTDAARWVNFGPCVAYKHDSLEVPGAENLFLERDLGDKVLGSLADQIPYGLCAVAVRDAESSDVFDHGVSILGAPLALQESVVDLAGLLVESQHDVPADRVTLCGECCPL